MDVEVITPVGPGHEEIAIEAIASAMAMGFECLPIDDTQGKLGRSRARNTGVKIATAEWLFFLDADDLMHKDARKADKFKEYDAVFGLINDGKVRVPQARKIDYETLLKHDPTQTLQMGHFVKRKVALEYPFNEDMDCGEDFDYYIRLWKDKKCIKIPHTLFVNRRGFHSTGPRSATGKQWTEAVSALQARALHGNTQKKAGDYYVPSADRMFAPVFERGVVFDCANLSRALEFVDNRRLALDIGAHVGSWSNELSKTFDSVEAFEAADENYACLIKNISSDNINIHNMAIGEKEKKVSMDESDPFNSGKHHVLLDEGNIEMRSVDSFNYQDVDFIKMDIEGYEFFGLKGAEETLKRCSPVVLIEQNGLEMNYGLQKKEAGKYLESLGYELKAIANKDYIYAQAKS